MTLLEKLGGAESVTAGIVSEFRALSALPHPSWGEGESAHALARRLEGWGLSPILDQWNNLRCDVPASPGQERSPLLILQGHLDMVCAVRPGSGWRPASDPVTVVTEDGWLRSDGRSSLGADNNLGNAAVLWLLGQGLSHGPLRLIFTVAEEVGLQGAGKLNPAWLEGGRYLLNTDGFRLGRLVVSSAGGRRETYLRPLETRPPQLEECYTISLTGGTGGHSGEDIHLGRANAVALMAGLLIRLGEETSYELAELDGGTGHNAIPAAARAVVLLPAGRGQVLSRLATALLEDWRKMYGETDPGLSLCVDGVPQPNRVWTAACRDDTLSLIGSLPLGVYAPHPWVTGVTGASANLGRVCTDAGDIQVCAFLRSAGEEEMTAMAQRHDEAARHNGFVGRYNAYPGWPGDPDSPLARTMERVWLRETGRACEITAVHVGLEPSVFHEMAPALDMVCTGPDILDAHSVDERAPLACLPDYACLLAGTLEAVGAQG